MWCLVTIGELPSPILPDQILLIAKSSPSPAPAYDNFGRRNNTREMRYRRKLEEERHQLVEKALKTIPEYHPPADYRRPAKTQEKVYVPVNDYPEINFSKILILTFLTSQKPPYEFVCTWPYEAHILTQTIIT
jgi:hypothetical protein